ncbi:putative disease resistance protein At4g10780 [Telopea speciosissima]|uniref:putative disease resistance protein At4g10780 n=1 Tax=Telopea speciosissima TaxID=54955 RepID=UPI001CC7B33D|nr:putative disease resistance protein At4g10780 [Telopea speciosissima]
MPVLAAALSAVGGLISVVTPPFLRHLGFLVHYKTKINELRNQMERLEKLRIDVGQCVDVARSRGQVIKQVVSSWLDTIDATQREVIVLYAAVEENKGCCLQYDCGRARYRVGKEAKRKTDVVINLQREGSQFDSSVSIPPPPPPGIESMPMLNFQAFEPTKLAKEQIMEALGDKKLNFIGVYGMGGVGKTTLMNELATKLKNKRFFDRIVMITVSQNIIFKKILQITWGSNSRKQMNQGGDIIRNDGRGGYNCSVIITTRFLQVCDGMNTQYNVELKELPEADAWELFRMSAGGDRVDSSELYEVAREVVKACGGLPVALVTVGKALRNRDRIVWVDAVTQLKKSMPSRIQGMEQRVFSSIKLSFDYLESEETRRCFLFCCLFPEDFIISEDDLLPCVWAEDIFEAIENMNEARNRLHAVLDTLKRSSLLLTIDGRNGCVRMHDIIRDVAIWIASQQSHHGFVVKAGSGLEEWPNMENYLRNCKRLSLMQNEISKFPEKMGYCSQLLTLLLRDNQSLREIPDGCFEGMISLKVLDLRNTNIVSIPSSFSWLTEQLRVLHLNIVESSLDLSVLGNMKKLEILNLSGSHELRILPQEIGGLTNLKSLDLSRNSRLIIPPKVLSRLSRLEELYVLESFDDWEAYEGSKTDGSSSSSSWSSKACLSKVASLARLTRLELIVSNIECLSSNNTISLCAQNLTRFYIGCPFNPTRKKLGRGYDIPTVGNYEATMLFWEIKIPNELSNWAKVLLGRTERLILDECHGPKTIYPQLGGEGSGLNNLGYLQIENCEDLEHILIADHHHHVEEGISAPLLAFNRLEELKLHYLRDLKEVCHGPFLKGTLENLTILEIYKCHNLKHIFQMSMAQGLPKLEDITIGDCNDLEDIFMKNEGEDEEEGVVVVVVVVLPRLRMLELCSLPNFSTVCPHHRPRRGVISLHDDDSIKIPVLESLYIYNCPNLRRIPISPSPESTPRLRRIYVEETWFNHQLEWGEPSDKLHLQRRVQVELNNVSELTNMLTEVERTLKKIKVVALVTEKSSQSFKSRKKAAAKKGKSKSKYFINNDLIISYGGKFVASGYRMNGLYFLKSILNVSSNSNITISFTKQK